ncbi:hypothetical protein CAPTEDRAFT_201893 [Capitella teleta]|uniref:Mab-21-like nucleotidyltransferase domain-containing protein n=1 Tax=Capitella teleta TaxID=283909 RepID=R7VKS2_CAPTE|nr:hypothetical protein CAPTEDRAFT_201893 [Capitella teleta]|eukprot:ELU17010.1 hypothetical protein CAPTEDRAFT_201893 [Capitella teleta]
MMEAFERSFQLPLHYAAIYRDIAALQTGDAQYINIEFADCTPLVLAVSSPNSFSTTFLHPLEIYTPIFPNKPDLNATLVLLERGADVNYSDSEGKTPLLSAIEADASLAIIQALVNHGANVQHHDCVGRNALHYLRAYRTYHDWDDDIEDDDAYHVVKYLLDKGADPYAADMYALTGVEAVLKNYEVLRGMIDHGVDLADDRLTSDNQSTLLHHACFEWSGRRIVDLLVEKGFDVDARNDLGRTPLQQAVCGERIESGLSVSTIKALLKHAPDLSLVDHLGQTPLHLLCRNKLFKSHVNKFATVLELLVHAGVDVNQKNIFGRSPTFESLNSSDQLQILINHGADVNCFDYHGASIIHYSCLDKELSHLITTENISKIGDDLYGSSLLHYAAHANVKEVVQKLIELGADVDKKDFAGQTPLDIAQKNGFTSIVKLLAGEDVVSTTYPCRDSFIKLSRHDIESGDFGSLVQPDDTKEFSRIMLSSSVIGKCEASSEVVEIKEEVMGLLSRMSEMAERKLPYLAFEPKLRGSMAEGTKCGAPDEFDVMFILPQLGEVFDAEIDHSMGRNKYARLQYNRKDGGNLKQTYPYLILESGDLNSNILYYIIFNTLSSLFADQNVWKGHKMTFRDFVPTNSFMMAKLLWTGPNFKNLEIDVDFVPCIPIEFDFSKVNFSWPLPINLDAASVFALLVNSPMKEHLQFEVSFTEIEQLMVASLPRAAIDAYVFAKAIRHPQICPIFQQFYSRDGTISTCKEPWVERAQALYGERIAGRTFEAGNYLKSYYLKCALFHLVKEKAEAVSLEDIQCYQWTRWIYQYLSAACDTSSLLTYIQHHNVLEITRAVNPKRLRCDSWKVGQLCDPQMFSTSHGVRGSDESLQPIDDETLEKHEDDLDLQQTTKVKMILKVISFLLRVNECE